MKKEAIYEVEIHRPLAAAPCGFNHLLQYESNDTDPEVGSASGHSVPKTKTAPVAGTTEAAREKENRMPNQKVGESSPQVNSLPSLTPGEQEVYERARRLWLAFGAHVRGEAFIRPTLGAKVSRAGGWVGRAS
jgi:hypothetical protein